MFWPRQYHWLGHRRAESATAPRSDEIDDQIECKRVVKWSAISHGIPIVIPTKKLDINDYKSIAYLADSISKIICIVAKSPVAASTFSLEPQPLATESRRAKFAVMQTSSVLPQKKRLISPQVSY